MRKKWLINRPFQLKVIVFGFSIGATGILSTFLALKFFFAKCHAALLQAGLPSDHPGFAFLSSQQRYMGLVFLILLFFNCVISILAGLYLSHRVAGPLHRMKQHFLAAASGKVPTRLHFRKHDFFQEVADAYNSELEVRGLFPRIKSGDDIR